MRFCAQDGGIKDRSATRILFNDGIGMLISPQMIGLSPVVGCTVLKLHWVVMFGPPLCFGTASLFANRCLWLLLLPVILNV